MLSQGHAKYVIVLYFFLYGETNRDCVVFCSTVPVIYTFSLN